MKMEGVDLIRTLRDDYLLVGIDKKLYPDLVKTLLEIIIRYGLPMPLQIVEDDPEYEKWGVVFEIRQIWWRLYLEDWIPCSEEWLPAPA